MYNFKDDNPLSAIAKNVKELKTTLQSELGVVINWFKNNKMIVNPEKFQAIILYKQKLSNEKLSTSNLILKNN